MRLRDPAIRIPASAVTLAGFREWVLSDDFPEFGRFSYIQGELFIDMSPEELDPHNRARPGARPCHSCSMPRISRAQSNSIDPFGNSDTFSKKLERTSSTSNGSTCQLEQRSSRPWKRDGSGVAEYPSEPAWKNAEASSSEGNTEDGGNSSARRPRTSMLVTPSSLRKPTSKRFADSVTANRAW